MMHGRIKDYASRKLSYVKDSYIYYLSGLWLSFKVRKDVKSVDIKINGTLLETFTLSKDGVNDIHFDVQKVAQIIETAKFVEVEINCSETKSLLVKRSFSVDDIYYKEFQFIDGSVNACISHVSLINEYSVSLLTEEQVIKVVDFIYQSNLHDAYLNKVRILLGSLAKVRSSSRKVLLKDKVKALFVSSSNNKLSDQLFSLIGKNQDCLNILFALERGKLRQHPFYNLIISSLLEMKYLDAEALIEFSELTTQEKAELIKVCVTPDKIKFEFIKNFPIDEDSGIAKWNSLTSEQKKVYWPYLACHFEYLRQFQRIAFYPPQYNWLSEKTNDEYHEQLKAIIQAVETKWFGMSIILFEYERGLEASELIPHLQEFIWANWNQNYINIDTLCYVLSGLLERELTPTEYSNIIDILIELFRNRIEKNENDLYRQCLIECITHYLNEGVKKLNWSFGRLAELVRPYYAFDDYFINNIDYSQTKRFDQTFNAFCESIYGRVRSIKNFFAHIQHNTPPLENELREVFSDLLFLREHGVYFTEKWVLALSRYCQLQEVKGLYAELGHIHESIEDYYGSMILAQTSEEKSRLERLITERGKYATRKDSYWFERLLQARLEGEDSRVAYISELNQFLLDTEVNGHYINDDLVHLLSSEIIHYLIVGGDYESISEMVEHVRKPYVDGYTAIILIQWILNKTITSTSLKQLEMICGEKGELDQFLSQFGYEKTAILSEKTCDNILISIKQHYVYPYLQVMIYSCNAYENTRHKVIRESWLPKLKALDIDYCFVVGDAEQSHMDDDIMRLKVLDTYEELPRKSIEMFRFAHINSAHLYYYKLDDDCVLNINAVFGDPSFLHQNYFGRVVKRPLGGVDRIWHQKKSRSQLAKESLDLSPEYSEYCDGSTGYILSRWAAQELTQQANSAENEQLVNCSYFEDKLIGDLLTKASVNYTDFGYHCVIRRKVAAGRDLQMWDYGILPSPSNNIKVLHTEDDDYRLKMGKQIEKEYDNIPHLIYRDIASDLNPEWLSVGEQAPVLEKLSVNEAEIVKAKHLAIIVSKNEQELFPSLLEHHRKLGIEHFLFVDNCSDDSSIEYMLKQDDVSVFVATQEYKYSRFAVNWQETLLSHYGLGRWVLIVDTDELYCFEGCETQSISSLTNKSDQEKANVLFAPMIDFYPKNELDGADITDGQPFYEVCSYYDDLVSMDIASKPFYGPFSNAPCWHGGLRKRVFGSYNTYPQPNYVNQKYNLIKYQPSMRLIEGLHFMYGHSVSAQPVAIMHFKYHAGFYKKVIREIDSGQHWNGATEYKRYAKRLENKGSDVLFDETASRKFVGSSELLSERNK